MTNNQRIFELIKEKKLALSEFDDDIVDARRAVAEANERLNNAIRNHSNVVDSILILVDQMD